MYTHTIRTIFVMVALAGFAMAAHAGFTTTLSFSVNDVSESENQGAYFGESDQAFRL